MSKDIKKIRLFFIITFSSFAVSSAAICSIPFVQFLPEKSQLMLNYIIAALFWSGLILGMMFSIRFITSVVYRCRKELPGVERHDQRLYGIVRFSCKLSHILIYVILALGIAIIISDIIFRYISEYIMFPIISVVFFAFVAHCVIDGDNYKFYKIIREKQSHDDYEQ